ncbi:MAG: ribosome maturation factor RimM [Gammaproteobacteria bacterium]|nr:ribosome maturation factor RimM [Gammaproteobacteria bacterium]
MSDLDEKIVAGKITGIHGLKGWVKVFSDTDPREGITDYSPWFLQLPNVNAGQWREIRVEAGRPQAKTVIAKLEGYDTANDAMELVGSRIAINADQLKPLSHDEYYWRDLIGLRVVNQQDVELGVVEKLFETGANDVLVVKNESQERLIPWTLGHAVLEVDLEQGVIRVDWHEDY